MTPGQQLCQAFADTFRGGGWAEAPNWDSYDEDGRQRWEDAARRYAEIQEEGGQ